MPGATVWVCCGGHPAEFHWSGRTGFQEEWDSVFAVNVRAPFALTKECLELLTAAGSAESHAAVINITSVDGIRSPPPRHIRPPTPERALCVRAVCAATKQQ